MEAPGKDNPAAGAGAGGFPSTRWSAIIAARSADPAERARALDALLAAYWRPVYKYIRLGCSKSVEDAQDLTQEFFCRVLENDLLQTYDPQRGRLRTYLRACVDHLVANAERDQRRQKRGGGALHESLDFISAESELGRLDIPQPPEMESFFEHEWARSVFRTGVERLRAELAAGGKTDYFAVFERYDLQDPERDPPNRRQSYKKLGDELGLTPSQVTNYLAHARREFRRIVLDFLRTTTANEQEFQREASALLGTEQAPEGGRPR
jgi:RNA polymerase sigma factor (sigma-70 family)